MNHFLTAIGFLTIIPAPKRGREVNLAESMAYFPLAGLLIGTLLYIGYGLLYPYLPERLVNLILIALIVAITGGLHIDGFMDTVDGIAGGKNRDDILRIMRDSPLGAIGAAAVILLILLKWEALNSIGHADKKTALLLMPVLGRWSMVLLARLSPYAREEGLALSFVDGLTAGVLACAFSVTLFLTAFFYGYAGIILLIIVSVISYVASLWFNKKTGGITGDVIGACGEVTELSVLLFFCGVFS